MYFTPDSLRAMAKQLTEESRKTKKSKKDGKKSPSVDIDKVADALSDISDTALKDREVLDYGSDDGAVEDDIIDFEALDDASVEFESPEDKILDLGSCGKNCEVDEAENQPTIRNARDPITKTGSFIGKVWKKLGGASGVLGTLAGGALAGLPGLLVAAGAAAYKANKGNVKESFLFEDENGENKNGGNDKAAEIANTAMQNPEDLKKIGEYIAKMPKEKQKQYNDIMLKGTTEQKAAVMKELTAAIGDTQQTKESIKVVEEDEADEIGESAEDRINPDDIPELTDKRDEGGGIVSYEVQDDEDGQIAMRRIIDTHWGKSANPWCLLARKKMPSTHDELDRAWGFWQEYSAIPKRVAFKNGELLAFSAADDDSIKEMLKDEEEILAEYEEWIESEEVEENGYPELSEWVFANHPEIIENGIWWDRKDNPHIGLDWAGGHSNPSRIPAETDEFVEVNEDGEDEEQNKKYAQKVSALTNMSKEDRKKFEKMSPEEQDEILSVADETTDESVEVYDDKVSEVRTPKEVGEFVRESVYYGRSRKLRAAERKFNRLVRENAGRARIMTHMLEKSCGGRDISEREFVGKFLRLVS